MQLYVQRLNERAILPSRSSRDAAGYDLAAAIDSPVSIPPGETVLIPTGLAMELPSGHFGLIKDRSSLAIRGLRTGAGVIDSDYRGEVKVVIHNVTTAAYTVAPGERIAQMVILAHAVWDVVDADELSSTARGEKGFGSTGSGSH